MAKVYSTVEFNRLITGREAELGVEYKTTSGDVYVGIEDGLLRLKGQADNTAFTSTTNNTASDVQTAIDNVSGTHQVAIYFDNNSNLSVEGLYVTIADTTIKSTSIINAFVSIDSTRDVDELEFVDFNCTAVNIVEGVGYDILVVDNSLQAEDKYILNITKKN